AGIRPLSSRLYRLNPADPVVSIQLSRRERRDHFENLIREAADVQDIFTLRRLRRPVRLDVQTNQLRLRVALAKLLPGVHQLRSASRAAVDPRLVVRNKDDEITLRSPVIQQLHRSAAVGSAS